MFSKLISAILNRNNGKAKLWKEELILKLKWEKWIQLLVNGILTQKTKLWKVKTVYLALERQSKFKICKTFKISISGLISKIYM